MNEKKVDFFFNCINKSNRDVIYYEHICYFCFFFVFFFHCSNEKANLSSLGLLAFINNSSNETENKKKPKEKEEEETINQIAETAPTQLKTTQVSNAIILSWDKIKGKNGKEFSSYEVSINEGNSWKETKENFYTFKKLTKNQKYSLQVRPKGNSKLVAKITATLGDNPPNKPQNLQVAQTGENLITLDWKESTDDDNDPISYQVSKDGINWNDIGSKTSWTFQRYLLKLLI